MAETAETPQKIWYEANCHCGAVKYKVLTEDISKKALNQCNCSICTKNGYVTVIVMRDEIVFHQGQETVKRYRFKGGDKDHVFCPICGSSLMIDLNGTMKEYFDGDVLSVNVRMFKDIDMEKLEYKTFDGKTLLPGTYDV